MTPKQTAFVREYLIDRNATQAAIRAGYSEDTARAIGSENLTKPYIQQAIDDAEAKLRAKAEVTIESIAAELDAAHALAAQIGQPSAMVSASLGKAKLYGLIVEKKEHRIADARPATMADAVGFASRATTRESPAAGDEVLH